MTHGEFAHKNRVCVQNIKDAEVREPLQTCLKEKSSRLADVTSCNVDVPADVEYKDGICYRDCDVEDPLFILCKDESCWDSNGKCGNPPKGEQGCTWSIAPIGVVMLDDLEGKPGSWKQPGGVCFWNGIDDPVRARERVLRVAQLFHEQYPDLPGNIAGPKCPY